MQTATNASAKAENVSLGTRLDSWKEIAAYLARGERTVKRWETERGLPIHRVPGGGRASVYAFSVELDAWLKLPSSSEENVADDLIAEVLPVELNPSEQLTVVAEAINSHPHRFGIAKHWIFASAAICSVIIVGFAAKALAAHHTPWLSSTALASAKSLPHTAVNISDAEKQTARELFLKGRYEWNQRTPESLNRALDDFTQALVHNPEDAQSYAGLADTYNLLHIYATLPFADSYPRALAAARRAVELDDSLPEAHRALAFVDFYGAGNWTESEHEFRRAIELNPNDAVARRWYANAFATPGRYEESLRQFAKAQELDPSSHSTLSDEGIILFNSGRQAEGISMLKQVERTNPSFFSPHFYLMMIGFDRRDFSTFLKEGELSAELRKDNVWKAIIAAARTGYEQSGTQGLLAALYEKEEQFYQNGQLPAGLLAKTCLVLGKHQEAIRLLEEDYDRHEADALWCITEPDFKEALKDEPEYQAFIQRIGFPSA